MIKEKSPLPEHLTSGLAAFLTRRTDIQGMRFSESAKELATEQLFLEHFYTDFLTERIARSEELNSPEIKALNEEIIELFGSKLGITSCMDGRLPIAAIWGFPMESVRAMRVPGGDIPGFYFDLEAKEYRLDTESLFAKILTEQVGSDNRTRFQVLNAHRSCAARSGKEKDLGKAPQDGGLFQDVKKKREMGVALQKQFRIIPIIYVPDPETGFGYMGLGQDALLEETTQLNGGAFSETDINDLVVNKKIISTKQLAEDFSSIFSSYRMTIDWEHKYKDTALGFWKNIKTMICDTEVLERIMEKVKQTYSSDLTIQHTRDEEEVRVRALLLLTNAYLGWSYATQDGHPYKEHAESCVVIDYKNKGPFKEITAFVVAPDAVSVDDNTVIAQNIVRANRARGSKVQDFTNTYGDTQHFVEAPVPVVLKTEIPAHGSNRIWEDLKNLDWSAIQDVWLTMKESEFKNWLATALGQNNSYELVEKTIDTLLDMRRNLNKLYGGSSSSLVERGGISILPLLVSDDRKPQVIVPLAA